MTKCASKRCGKELPADSDPSRRFCNARCKSEDKNTMPGENGHRFLVGRGLLAALDAAGGKASLLRLCAVAGATVKQGKAAVIKLEDEGMVTTERDGEPADWIVRRAARGE